MSCSLCMLGQIHRLPFVPEGVEEEPAAAALRAAVEKCVEENERAALAHVEPVAKPRAVQAALFKGKS